MFIDKATIIVSGGDGGMGCMSFRREKFIPKGGPNGGDGGKGGDVYLRANLHFRTLLDFIRKPRYEAQKGEAGSGYTKNGRGGKDIILDVPCGTAVFKGETLLIDLTKDGDMILVAKGGRGGRGNVHFKSSVRQAPRIAEKGEPAEKVSLNLQLKLIADVGLIGCPNAGKSTLLSRLTRARPKIADYPFTTLFPNLGVAQVHDQEIIFADIPGLIEGSHEGKGLGIEFLQHIERTRILIHVVDPLGYGGKTPKESIRIINNELKGYSKLLGKKRQVIVVNKQDLTEGEKVFKDIKRSYKKQTVLPLSGISGIGLEDLLNHVVGILEKEPFPEAPRTEDQYTRIQLEPEFWIENKNGSPYIVKGKKVERLVAMTPMNLPEAVERTQNILKKIGVERALITKGAKEGDPIQIAGIEFTFHPEI